MGRVAPDVLTVQVTFTIRKRGGRKVTVMPDGQKPERAQVDNTVVMALARAFRWKRLIDSGDFATISDLAEHEKLAPSYLTRVLRLPLLAPDIVQGIVEGRIAPRLAVLLKPFPVAWQDQITAWRCQPTAAVPRP